MWKFRDTVIPNVALNAVAGRPKEEYGIEPTGLDEIRPGCYNVDERVKDMNAGGILASICFPSFPGFAGRLFATDDHEFSIALGAGLQRLAHRGVVRGVPGAVHPDGDSGDLGCRGVRRGGAAGLEEGRARADLHREPGRDGLPQLPQRVLEPAVESVGRHRHRDERAHRILGPAGDHGARCADGRDDHAAADEHRAGRRGSAVVAADQGVPGPEGRPVRGRHRLDPLLPGASGPDLRNAFDVDPPGLQAASCPARFSGSTS